MKRLPASMRSRESLSELIEGRLSTANGNSELVTLATRLMVEEALEVESQDTLGGAYYQQGDVPAQGLHNVVLTGRLMTAEGPWIIRLRSLPDAYIPSFPMPPALKVLDSKKGLLLTSLDTCSPSARFVLLHCKTS